MSSVIIDQTEMIVFKYQSLFTFKLSQDEVEPCSEGAAALSSSCKRPPSVTARISPELQTWPPGSVMVELLNPQRLEDSMRMLNVFFFFRYFFFFLKKHKNCPRQEKKEE